MNQESPNAREAAQQLFVSPGPMPLCGKIDKRDWDTICDTMQGQANAGRILSAWIAELQTNLKEANRKVDQAIQDRDNVIAAKAETADQPRTIVLMYKPFRRRPEDIPFDSTAPWDSGGTWDIGEAGDYQSRLDAREALALVAAMLLGAPHPQLQSIDMHEKIAREDATRRALDDAEFTEVVDHD